MEDPTAEEWRPIEGHVGYEVSDLGRVRSIDRDIMISGKPRPRLGRVLFQRVGGSYSTYRYVALGSKKGLAVHVLVCVAFHGSKPGPGYQVAHGNGDSFDNRAVNLRWATPSENNLDKIRHGTLATQKLDWERVRAIRAEWNSGGVRQADLHRRYGVSRSAISSIVHRRTWIEEAS